MNWQKQNINNSALSHQTIPQLAESSNFTLIAQGKVLSLKRILQSFSFLRGELVKPCERSPKLILVLTKKNCFQLHRKNSIFELSQDLLSFFMCGKDTILLIAYTYSMYFYVLQIIDCEKEQQNQNDTFFIIFITETGNFQKWRWIVKQK